MAKQTSKQTCKKTDTRVLSEKFRKRRNGIFKKADELARLTDAKIYIFVQRGTRCYTLKSAGERENWPPLESELVSHLASPNMLSLNIVIELINSKKEKFLKSYTFP